MAKNRKTQEQKILGFLGTGKQLTVAQAENQFGITRLAARIYDLRVNGWTIYTNNTVVRGGVNRGQKVTAYRLQTTQQSDAVFESTTLVIV